MDIIKHHFTIKDLENISGIKAHTIRVWEKRYNLLKPKRTQTNIRYYSSASLQKLLNIVFLNKNKFKISKIASMSEELILSTSRELATKLAKNNNAINSFKLAMFQFDRNLFNTTYNELLEKKPFREIFATIFIPLLEQIGLLWQTKTVLPAHEHFISNLITQKVQINTENLNNTIVNSDKVFVLFLPENEIHELGLLYVHYELTLRGYYSIYLGQSLPLSNLSCFFRNNKSITFITNLTVQPYEEKIKMYFDEIDTILKSTKHQFIAIGKKTELVENINFSSKIHFYKTIKSLLKTI